MISLKTFPHFSVLGNKSGHVCGIFFTTIAVNCMMDNLPAHQLTDSSSGGLVISWTAQF